MNQIATKAPSLAIIFISMFLAFCNPPDQARVTSEQIEPISLGQRVKAADSAQISEYVVSLYEDKKGNLWFGTMSDGVVRFDGKELTYFSKKDGLCDNTVASIAEDDQGNLWFGTHAGASKFDGKTFTNYRSAEGLHGAGCEILIDKHGQVWAGTNHGAFRFNGVAFTRFDIPVPSIEKLSFKWEAGKVWNLMEDKQGNIWFARDGYGACKYDGKIFAHFTKKDGLCSNNVSSIVADKQGNIWLGTLTSDLPEPVKEGGLCCYDGNKIKQFSAFEGLSKNDIYSLYCDQKGNVWAGATGLGVYRYDGKSFKLFKGTDRMDLTYNLGIQSIMEDRKGNLWFGFSGGLFRFDGTSIKNVPQGGPWK